MFKDTIRIEKLHIYAHHGVLPEEKEKGQNFFFDIAMHCDVSKAGRDDDLTESTNYAEVCETVKKVVTENCFDLIETVAWQVAKSILLEYPLIKSVDVKVNKPEAPIPMEFDNVSVEISRGWSDVYLSYGSNMGDSRALIEEGLKSLTAREDVRMCRNSSLIITKPYGGVEQDDFVNGACHIQTILNPEELLEVLHEIEAAAGRERIIHWGPRTLDMDILMYDNLVYESETLIIPHVDMQNRSFVLEPMCEIAAYKRHPVLGLTMQELLNKFNS